MILLVILFILALPILLLYLYTNKQQEEGFSDRDTLVDMEALPNAPLFDSLIDIQAQITDSKNKQYEVSLDEFKKQASSLKKTTINTSSWISTNKNDESIQLLSAEMNALFPEYPIVQEGVRMCKTSKYTDSSEDTYYDIEWILYRSGRQYGFHVETEFVLKNNTTPTLVSLRVWGLIPELNIQNKNTPVSVYASPYLPYQDVNQIKDTPELHLTHQQEEEIYCKKMKDFKDMFGIVGTPNKEYTCS